MYKHYNMNQITLPLETEVLIPDNDISKAVHTLVESMPEAIFEGFRQSQGASSYHPKMMLKILLCAYSHAGSSIRVTQVSWTPSSLRLYSWLLVASWTAR